MTTLQAIGFTIAGGSVIFTLTLSLFGCAVSKRSTHIAPRCTARHPDTIYNPDPSRKKKNVQDRGNPWIGWMKWTLGLSYDTMLRGIPGTGTRNGGLGGSMLSVNLDSVILFRFHALCLKASALATFLCITIILPINLTARCHNTSDPQCLDATTYTLTNYEKTTLANIPPLEFGGENNSQIRSGIWGSTYPALLVRLYAIVFCSWAVSVFTCKLVAKEWIACLAMRRVYYLEADIWGKRKEELNETLLKDDEDNMMMDRIDEGDDNINNNDEEMGGGGGVPPECAPSNDHFPNEFSERTSDFGNNNNNTERTLRKRRSSLVDCAAQGKRRDPWIPHPEQRDTVPNIELYSVLVGGLPSLPSEVVDEQDMETAQLGFSRRQSIDWQLAVATTFFDHCVPNQPGYSSSVAAVTILPDAPELARAWRRWYVAAAAVRRLRFIRSLIAERRHYDIDFGEEEEEDVESSNVAAMDSMSNASSEAMSVNSSGKRDSSSALKKTASRFKSFRMGIGGNMMGSINENSTEVGSSRTGHTTGANRSMASSSHHPDSKAIYLDTERRVSYYRGVFGASDDEDVERHLYQALDYGPEQSAQYSREAAQGAASCCPNGCGEERLRQLPIDELIEMEEEAFQAVQEANVNLRYAQAQAAVSTMETHHAKMHLPEKGNSEDIVQHAEEDQKHAKMHTMHSNFYGFNGMKSNGSSLHGGGIGGGVAGGESENNLSVGYHNESFGGSSPRHKHSASLDCVNLPESMELETQLLQRYNTPGSEGNMNGKSLVAGHRKVVSHHSFGHEETHHRSGSEPPVVSPFIRSSSNQSNPSNAGFEMYEKSDLAAALEAEGADYQNNLGELPRPPSNVEVNPSRRNSKKRGTPPLPPSFAGTKENNTPFPKYTARDSSHPLLINTNTGQSRRRSSGNNRIPSINTAPVPSSEPLSRNSSHNSVPVRRNVSDTSNLAPSASSLSSNTANTAYERRRSSQVRFQRTTSTVKRQSLAMTSEGKITFVEDVAAEDEDEQDENFFSPRVRTDIQRSRSIMMRDAASKRNLLVDDEDEDEDDDRMADNWTDSPKRDSYSDASFLPPPSHDNGTAARRRANTAESAMGLSTQWAQVEQIIADEQNAAHPKKSHPKTPKQSAIGSGVWEPLILPSMKDVTQDMKKRSKSVVKWATNKTTDVVDDLARDSTFAVVTFTSRQAAVAARHCLADGRGADRWLSNQYLPVPPLADAAPCDFITCRGCCRPVTVSLNEKQKMIRKYSTWAILGALYVFWTFPITFAAGLADPEKLFEIWPGLERLTEESVLFSKLLSGIVPALLYTAFFALCPVIFKAISNYGSNAESQQVAEHCALKYFWWFMVVTAFSGSSLLTLALNAINERQLSGSDIADVLGTIARTIPTQISATWLNWIIVRLTITLPLQYMLQMNTFIFDALGWRCCARCVKGGGPGGPIPYRIYIDSGVVLLCTFALAPASPLVAPAALFYFLYCQPLWRRNCIFLYRPKFDSGGLKWPFLSDMCISGMLVGQILLTTMMALKEAVGPAVFAAIPIIPTILFRRILRNRFSRAYLDAALLQTSLLDGWDNTYSTMEKREEFRQFLIDAHKAAYIPVCIAGGATSALTAEPAVTVPNENDEYDFPIDDVMSHFDSKDHEIASEALSATGYDLKSSKNQLGASFRRVSSKQSMPSKRSAISNAV